MRVLQTLALPLGYVASGLDGWGAVRRREGPAQEGRPLGKERGWMERETGFEPATPTLARLCSTTELFPLAEGRLAKGAGGCQGGSGPRGGCLLLSSKTTWTDHRPLPHGPPAGARPADAPSPGEGGLEMSRKAICLLSIALVAGLAPAARAERQGDAPPAPAL
jgi:hypothetical protein